jgi:hypothetical protein
VKRISYVVLLILSLGMGSLLAQDSTAEPGAEAFSGDRALAHVADFVAVGPRATATLGSLQAGNLVLSYLSELGWETSEDWHTLDFGSYNALTDTAKQTLADWQPFEVGNQIDSYLSGLGDDSTGEWIDPQFDQVVVPVRNLVASYGEGPIIIIGAHYDSRIYADHDTDTALQHEPMPGANDGGSGVGVLMELARVLSENYTPNAEIRLVFFDAEDNGRIEPFPTLFGGFANGYLVGSTLYASTIDPATQNIQYMLLVDMVGDTEQRFPMEGYSVQYAAELNQGLWDTAAALGYDEQFIPEPRGPIIDDHVPFLQRGIIAVDIIDLDYPYWHTTQDTLDKVDPDSLERVGRVLVSYLEETGAITRNAE